MFRAVVLTPDADFGRAVERLAFESQHVIISKTIPGLIDNPYEIGRIISAYDPELVLIDNTKPEIGLPVTETLRRQAPEVAVLALGGRLSEERINRFEEAGAAFLNGAFTHQQFVAAMKTAIHLARRNTFGPLFAVLPGKAGSGATTVAFNLATAVAAGLQKKVLVLEADLHSGVLSTLIDAKPRLPLIDVLQNSESLDYSQWLNSVVTAYETDFLLADRVKKTPLPSWMHYHQLLRFASARYDAIFVDLPEIVNEATDEIIQYAQFAFVVCTPELASLTLAGQRLHELRDHGAPLEKLRVVLNRWHRNDMKPEEIAGILHCPVSFVIKNDYRAIVRAISGCRPVGLDTDLGRGFLDFGKKLLGAPAMAEPKPRFAFF